MNPCEAPASFRKKKQEGNTYTNTTLVLHDEVVIVKVTGMFPGSQNAHHFHGLL